MWYRQTIDNLYRCLFSFFLSPMNNSFVSKHVFPQEAGVCTKGVSSVLSQELQPPEEGQKGSHTAQAQMAGTQAPRVQSDIKSHELRAALCDKA